MLEGRGFIESIKYWLEKLREWVKPNPVDKPLIRVLKLFYKTIVLLVLIALSPVLIVVLVFVFLAAR